MYKILISIFFIPILLLAYSDSDLDGVEDKLDQCMDTPLTELVDLSGCTTKKLTSPHHYDIVLGQSYAEDNKSSLNISQFQLGYYFKELSLLLSGAYYDLESDSYQDNGANDLYLDAYYQIRPLKNLRLQFGVGLVFPTYDSTSNKTDYRASMQASYRQDDFSLFGGLGATAVGDSSDTVEYNNTYFYKAGMGYYLSTNFYSSLTYNHSTSMYTTLGDIESLSLYGYYMINKNWFGTLKYAHGLSDNALEKLLGLKLGYYW